MIENLTFGCSKLTGGPSLLQSWRLLDACFSGGITRFDLAPSYGIGTAESTFGSYVQKVGLPRSTFSITSKVGSERPPFVWPKLIGRYIKRFVIDRPNSVIYCERLSDGPSSHSFGMKFDPRSMQESLERTLYDLKTDFVNTLLLHDVGRNDVSEETAAWLNATKQKSISRRVGSSIGGQYSEEFAHSVSPDWLVQTAPRFEWFSNSSELKGFGSLKLHSINKVFATFLHQRGNSGLAECLIQRHCGTSVHVSVALPLVAISILEKRLPYAEKIVSSSSLVRVNQLLAGLKWLRSRPEIQTLIMSDYFSVVQRTDDRKERE